MQPVVIAGLAATFLGLATAALAQGSDALRVHEVEIIDRNGFERPVPAARMLVPYDWQAQGGVMWNPTGQCSRSGIFEWAAWSPDGLYGVELMPNTSWQMNNLPAQFQGMDPCPKRNATSARQYLEQLAQERRPGARVLDYRDRPDLAQAAGVPEQRTPMAVGELRQWAEAGEVLLGYTYNGTPRREVIQATVVFTHSIMPDAMTGGTMETLAAFATPAFAFRAPDGRLDFTMVESLRSSIRSDPEYDRRMAAHYQAMGRIQAKGAADRAAVTSRHGEEMLDIINQGYQNRQRIIDEGHERFSRTIREVDVYNDPLAGQVELPSYYDRAWRLDGGDYLLSNDHNFEPWRDLGVNGTEMERLP
ncbi:MAG: hypothetical protein R3D25_03035 [Geminicoccaceae bacterium]